jgi:hypothetical protein
MRIETGFADLPSYGGPSGDTPTPPSPGESSQPVARQYGGPVEAGQPARVGEEGREMFVPDEQRGDPTKAAGQLASKLWEMLKSGGEDLIGKLHKTAMELTYDPQGFEKYDPSGPMGAAMMVTGGRMPFARAGEMGVGGGKMTQPGIKAYHGSPHEFEKFSTEHIGTGEGGQAYGHGLYFAENPRVAEAYKRSLAKATIDDKSLDQFLSDTPKIDTFYDAHRHLKTVHDRAIPIEEATKFYNTSPIPAERRVAEAINTYGSLDNARRMMNKSDVPILEKMIKSGRLKEGSGKMYEVNIKAEREHFLDWDKPLSEQHSAIKEKVLKALGLKTPTHVGQIEKTGRWAIMDKSGDIVGRADGWPDQITAKEAMKVINQDTERTQAKTIAELIKTNSQAINFDRTQKLKQAGIPGIKYLDQGSRAAGQGTSNFVVFNDALIDIIRKYGIAAIAAIPPAFSQTQKQ